MSARVFGDPEPEPTVRGTLQWLLVQIAALRQETPTLSQPMKTTLDLWKDVALQGLATRPPGSAETRVSLHSLLSHRDQRGRVELVVDEQLLQLDIGQALDLAREITAAAEAARADQALYEFATQRLGMTMEQATMLVQDSRVFRAAKDATEGLSWQDEEAAGQEPHDP